MRRHTILAGWVLAIAVAMTGPGRLRAADSPFNGTWKVTAIDPGQEVALWLLKVQDKDGKPTAEVVAAGLPNFKDAKLENIHINEAKGLAFTAHAGGLDIDFAIYPPEGEAAPKKLLGSAEIRGQRIFVRLEQTDAKEIDQKKAITPSPEVGELRKALAMTDPKEKQKALKEFVDKTNDPALGYRIGLELLSTMEKNDAAVADVRATAEKIVKTAGAYGPEIKVQAVQTVAKQLLSADKLAAVALEYARQAEQLLGKSDPPAQQVPVLKTLLAAQRKADKSADTKELVARIAKLDEVLDKEFAKNAIPFKPGTFAGRKGKSERVVLVELFTGAQCPPCVSADVAFDALLHTYQPSQVVLLQYHLHIPGPDPLTNKDSEKRGQFYGIQGTPSLFVDGQAGPPMGGYKQHSKERYDAVMKVLSDALETEPQAKLKLAGELQGQQLAIQAEVADLKKKGEDIRLCFVLVEEVVRYAGSNGQRLHHHVVRGFPGGVNGMALTKDADKQTVKVSLADVTKALDEYLNDFSKKRKYTFDDRPMDLKQLKLVAFIQDDASKEVLQAAQVDLAEPK
jgi:hypothetical protein